MKRNVAAAIGSLVYDMHLFLCGYYGLVALSLFEVYIIVISRDSHFRIASMFRFLFIAITISFGIITPWHNLIFGDQSSNDLDYRNFDSVA